MEMTLDGKPIELCIEVDGEKIDKNQLKNLIPKSGAVVKNNDRSSWTSVVSIQVQFVPNVFNVLYIEQREK